MKINPNFRVMMAAFISAFLISFFSFRVPGAVAGQPTGVVGHGHYEVNISLFGIDFSGDRTLSMVYFERNAEDGRGVATLRHDGRKITLDLICLLDEFVEDEGFYSVVGNIRKVQGYGPDDILFPKFAPPEVGDFVIVAFTANNGGGRHSVQDKVTIPFLFPPVFNGITVDCNTLVSPLGPPLSIIDQLFGDLRGKIRILGS